MSESAREALLQSDLFAAQRLLSEENGIPWHECSTVVFLSITQSEHYSMPPWINPYDARIIEDLETLKRWRKQGKQPTTMYQQRINVLALRICGKTWDDMKTQEDWRIFRSAKESAIAQLHADLLGFLMGFTDVTGNWWCGHCYNRACFMDIGADLDYPLLWVTHTEVYNSEADIAIALNDQECFLKNIELAIQGARSIQSQKRLSSSIDLCEKAKRMWKDKRIHSLVV